MESEGGVEEETNTNGKPKITDDNENNDKLVLLTAKASKHSYGTTLSSDAASDISSVSSVEALDHEDFVDGMMFINWL